MSYHASLCSCPMPEDDWGGNGGWHMTIQNGSPVAYERCSAYWRNAGNGNGYEVYILTKDDAKQLNIDPVWIGSRIGLRLSGAVERMV